MKRLILASGSPRRAKILRDLGVEFEIVKTDAPEVSLPHDPEGTVLANARAKLRAAAVALERDPPAALSTERAILAADTIVWFAGKIYGKPRDLAEAKAFLRELSGNTHIVFTGIAYLPSPSPSPLTHHPSPFTSPDRLRPLRGALPRPFRCHDRRIHRARAPARSRGRVRHRRERRSDRRLLHRRIRKYHGIAS